MLSKVCLPVLVSMTWERRTCSSSSSRRVALSGHGAAAYAVCYYGQILLLWLLFLLPCPAATLLALTLCSTGFYCWLCSWLFAAAAAAAAVATTPHDNSSPPCQLHAAPPAPPASSTFPDCCCCCPPCAPLLPHAQLLYTYQLILLQQPLVDCCCCCCCCWCCLTSCSTASSCRSTLPGCSATSTLH
jgi:hypothetical protein